jgi:hypothetical protein
MSAHRIRQGGQATVEHVGVLALVLVLLLAVGSVVLRSLHPPSRPPDLVGRIADDLSAPLGGRPSAPAAPAPDAAAGDAGAAAWPRPVGEPLQPFWIAMDLHHNKGPIGRWLGAAKDALAEHLPDMAEGCVSNVVGIAPPKTVSQVPARASVRREMGFPGTRAVRLMGRGNLLASCAVGAVFSLLP